MLSNINNNNNLDKMLENLFLSTYTRKICSSMYKFVSILGSVDQVWTLLHTVLLLFFFYFFWKYTFKKIKYTLGLWAMGHGLIIPVLEQRC